MENLLGTARTVQGLFGAGPLTAPDALRQLQAYPSEIRLVPHATDSEFHPKCYMGLLRDGSAWAAVGSANLTGGGAGRNVELLATVRGPSDHPFFQDLADWMEEVRSCGLPLTPELLAALEQAHGAFQAAVQAQAAAREQLGSALRVPGQAMTTAAELVRRLHGEALLEYVRTTRVFASYKLVILGLLLQSRRGRLSLPECARRFLAFYQALAAAGQQPERSTGSPPPDMLHPLRFTPAQVEQLLMKEPRTAFHRARVVLFEPTGSGVQVAINRSVWTGVTQPVRGAAFKAVVDRLEQYYVAHTGSARAVAEALRAAAREQM